MPIVGTMPIVDRIVVLLRTYLNGEVDQVDAGANALAGPLPEASFATPSLVDADIQYVDDDQQGRPIRVVVTIGNPPTLGRHQLANEGGGTGSPRQEGRHLVRVRVIVAKTDAAWGDDGAIRRCDRVATTIRTLLMRFPHLSVPAAVPALEPLTGTAAKLVNDAFAAGLIGEGEAQKFVAARDLMFEVLRIEAR